VDRSCEESAPGGSGAGRSRRTDRSGWAARRTARRPGAAGARSARRTPRGDRRRPRRRRGHASPPRTRPSAVAPSAMVWPLLVRVARKSQTATERMVRGDGATSVCGRQGHAGPTVVVLVTVDESERSTKAGVAPPKWPPRWAVIPADQPGRPSPATLDPPRPGVSAPAAPRAPRGRTGDVAPVLARAVRLPQRLHRVVLASPHPGQRPAVLGPVVGPPASGGEQLGPQPLRDANSVGVVAGFQRHRHPPCPDIGRAERGQAEDVGGTMLVGGLPRQHGGLPAQVRGRA
jgi:hypothetical protein